LAARAAAAFRCARRLLFAVDGFLVGRADDPRTIFVDSVVDSEAVDVFKKARGRAPNEKELYALRRVWLDNEVLYARASRSASTRATSRTTRAGVLSSMGAASSRVDDAQHLKITRSRIAVSPLSTPSARPLAVEHLVVEPDAAQRVQLLFVGRAAARFLEDVDGLAVHDRVHEDRPRVVGAADEKAVDGKEEGAEHSEMQQRLAQPRRLGHASRDGGLHFAEEGFGEH